MGDDIGYDPNVVFSKYSFAGSIEQYVPANINTLEGADDTEIINPVNGEILEYDGGRGKWVNAPNKTITAEFNDIDNVAIEAPEDDDVFTFDITRGLWVNDLAAEIPELDDLADVVTGNPTRWTVYSV